MSTKNGSDDTEPKPDETATESPETDEAAAETTDETPEAAADARVREIEAELADLKDRSLRALADAENTRRRAQREVTDARKYAAGDFAKDLLNVSDNLRRALDSVPAAQREADEHFKTLVEGVELVEKELLNAFSKHGITKIEPLGEPFDHGRHQAMFEIETTDQPAGTIMQLLQPGYLLHDRLLRPAMVAVAKEPPPPPTDEERVDTTV
jgi:molecular chaperone GrpE